MSNRMPSTDPTPRSVQGKDGAVKCRQCTAWFVADGQDSCELCRGQFHYAISLWQPWASLMAIGAKTIETRGWPTSYRGPILIHAAALWNRHLQATCKTEPFRSVMADLGMKPDALPRGALVGSVRISGCARVEHGAQLPTRAQELAFGNYAPGRWMWHTDAPVKFRSPIPLHGHQRIFRVAYSKMGIDAVQQMRGYS